MVGRRRQLSAAASLHPAPVTALLFLWSFTWAHVTAAVDIANMTALQKHVSFFDRNKDGIITPLETFEGFVAIGCEVAFSSAAASTIHAALGPITSPIFSPLPHLSIYVENIHRAMHGGDTGVLDAEGRFVAQKFEDIFTKYAKTRPDALTTLEVTEMVIANKDPLSPRSWVAPELEWGLIFTLASDHGFLHKDDVRGIYDGSVFVKLEEKRTPSRSEI